MADTTYRIKFNDNTGSFAVDAIAQSCNGDWRSAPDDIAFVTVHDDESADYLEEICSADDNVIEYERR